MLADDSGDDDDDSGDDDDDSGDDDDDSGDDDDDSQDEEKEDFNIVAPSSCQPGVLCDVGDEGEPVGVFPLSECQGDCDEDADVSPTD